MHVSVKAEHEKILICKLCEAVLEVSFSWVMNLDVNPTISSLAYELVRNSVCS